MSRRAAFTLAAVCAVIVMKPCVGAAQEVEVSTADLFAPPAPIATLPGSQVTLAEAVQLTIRHQPRVEQAVQDLRLAAGLHQGERGLFDMTVRAGAGFEYIQEPVRRFVLDLERQKRRVLDLVADSFTELNAGLRDVADGLSPTDLPRCPFDIDLDTGTILFLLPPGTRPPPGTLTFDLVDPDEAALQGDREVPISPTGELEDILSGFRDLCSRQIDRGVGQVRLDRTYRQLSRVDFTGNMGLEGALISGLEASRTMFPFLEEITETVAARSRLALERLGPLPEQQFRRSFSFSGGFTKPFRSGLTVSGNLLLRSEEENFRDKIMDPAFGGRGIHPSFPSSASLALDLPLGKGLGADAVAASERSAGFIEVARREQMRHTVAEEVYRTVLAYLHLVAAQESLDLLEESAARHERYANLTETLVNAEERPRIDLERARARAASVASSVSAARADVATARVSLAEAAGLDITTLDDAPGASDAFAELRQGLPAVDDLLRQASSRRRDRRALQHLREASTALARAARANLRRTFDFNITGGMSNLYESPFPRFFPDEEDPIFSTIEPIPERESPARYYSPRGFHRSLVGRWEPFVMAQFTVNFPFGNNTAKGQAARAEATLRSARIELTDRERVIRQNVVEARGGLQASAEAIERYRETVEQALVTRDGSRQLFEEGELSLIDALLTDDEATRDQLTLVRQVQLYLSTLARLKFEAGEIVSFANEGTPAEVVRFAVTDFVTQ